MYDGIADAIQIASEIRCLSDLLPFNVMDGMYYESFFIYGLPDINPALQDYIFEDADDEVGIVSDENCIYVVSSNNAYEVKAMLISEKLAKKLSDIGLQYERMVTSDGHRY